VRLKEHRIPLLQKHLQPLAVMHSNQSELMKILGLLVSFVLAQSCLAQFQLTKLDKSSLPKSIRYSGKIVQALRWTDNAGENIVLLTATGQIQSKNAPDDGYSDGNLYAYHFLVFGDSIKQTWKVSDFVKECPVDMFLYFIDKNFAITDLNNDGKAEVWIMYKVSCQGDVSPIPMKIIMYQDNKKYAMRGTTKVEVSPNKYMGGEFAFDEAFRNSPSEFRKYAEKLWQKQKIETWEK
jgi:hypothetical protein